MNESDNFEENEFSTGNSAHFKIDFGQAFLVAFVIIMSLIVTGTIVSFPAQFWLGFYHISLPLSFMTGGVLAIFALLAFLKIKWSYITAHLKILPRVIIAILAIFCYIFVLPFAEFMTSLVPTAGNPFIEELYKSTTYAFEKMLDFKVAGFLTICIIAPFFEEVLFRGILLRGLLQNNMHPAGAIALSSILFGIVHMNPWQFLGAGILGAVFAFVYYRTGSLLLCVFLHALNNTVSFLLMIKYQSMEENVSDPNNLPFIFTSLASAILVGLAIYKLTPHVKWI